MAILDNAYLQDLKPHHQHFKSDNLLLFITFLRIRQIYNNQ